jgi:predicted AlkP superfamily phosphohydrolase/phosphomutase
MKKTLLVGFDAACWEYLDPLLQTGRLPTVQRLIDSGTWGTLQSTLPALTPTAWASIITGKNPGKHGVFDMLVRHPDTYEFRPTNAQMRRGTPFWQRLTERGLRVGLINVPFTYPPEPIDGFVVTGFGTPNSASDFAYPGEVLKRITAQFGRYQPQVDREILLNSSPSEIWRAEQEVQAQQVEAAVLLSDQFPVEVLAINLMLLDHANHKMPHMSQVQEAICQTDSDLAYLIQSFQPDNVMLISDHGSRRVKGDFLLHAWLRDHGYCTQVERTSAEKPAALNWVLKQWLQARWGANGGVQSKTLQHLSRRLLPWLPQQISNRVWHELDQTVPFAREHVKFSGEIDYVRSSAYPGAQYSGLIYLNLVGRESAGVVSGEEKEAFLAKLVGELAQISDPDTNDPLFAGVYSSGMLYEGPMAELGPDIIIDSYNAQWNILSTFRRGARAENVHAGYFVDNFNDFGHHSRDGIFIFSGDDFNDAGFASGERQIRDVPATLLHLYGIPIPDDYDGRVLERLLAPEFVSQQPISYQPGDEESSVSVEDLYSPEEAEELLGHLRALGYVD